MGLGAIRGRAGRFVQHQIQRAVNRAGIRVSKVTDPRLTLDYPVSLIPRYGHGRPRHERIRAELERGRERYAAILAAIDGRRDLLDTIPAEREGEGPFWNNTWLAPLDASALMHFLLERSPTRYLEIGSGNSTMFARHAIRHAGLSTTITSIDPQPRREIDALCDRVIRRPLEAVDLAEFEALGPGDILFFDGSHRVFQDSDVTVFFLDILPRVHAGVLIHIHDIFWPDDYPPEWAERYYSEQYPLGVKILDRTIDTVFPSYFVSTDPDLGRTTTRLMRGEPFLRDYWGSSFWFMKR